LIYDFRVTILEFLIPKQPPNFSVVSLNKIAMIIPDNQIPLDDSDNSNAEDQLSQQDIHSNGLDDIPEPGDIVDDANPDLLRQAYEASESAYTLNLDDDDTDDDE